MLTVLIAPSGFKESLGVNEVTKAIARGVRNALSQAKILEAPMVDGGEGFAEALVSATRGEMRRLTVTGPVGDPVPSFFGLMGGQAVRTAVVEMAAAAGLSLVPRDQRNPMLTTSYGVGELIRAALDAGARRILIGCGDSGINDGGAGMAQALGVQLLDSNGSEIGYGGAELARLASIDVAKIDSRLASVTIDAAVNWHNVLLGERGVARVFGPQKGATPEQVIWLEHALEVFATAIKSKLGVDVARAPGSGASGGLGAGLMGLIGAKLHPRYDVVMQYLAFDRLLAEADLVITAEGSLDGQSPFGKIPCEVGRRAWDEGIPVIALAGTIGRGVDKTLEHGIDAFASIIKRPCTLEEAITDAEKLLSRAAEDAMRMVAVGCQLSGNAHAIRARRPEKRSPKSEPCYKQGRNAPGRVVDMRDAHPRATKFWIPRKTNVAHRHESGVGLASVRQETGKE